MKSYSCGFMFDKDYNVLLVRKKKPKWQEGRLNGIGGLTEEGESAIQSMRREFKEETGIEQEHWNHVCYLHFDDVKVDDQVRIDFFTTMVSKFPDLPGKNDIGEELVVCDGKNLPSDVITNLRWLIPLSCDPDGFPFLGGSDDYE